MHLIRKQASSFRCDDSDFRVVNMLVVFIKFYWLTSDPVIYLQDLTTKPKYLLALTVGYKQKDNINAAVKKVSLLFLPSPPVTSIVFLSY